MPALRALFERSLAILKRIDPNDDPTAEPLSVPAVVMVLVLTAISTFLFLRWKFQPMQDAGHHLAMIAVVVDYGRDGSLYPALYKPFDWLNTNSLLYTVAGLLGKIVGGGWGYRLSMASYVAGVPLANLWALRVFGRSAWGAVVAVPLAYNMSYVFGFANFLFAAPLAILAIPMFYRMLVNPTRRRLIASTVVITLLFLAHVHVFLWTGVLLFAMTVIAFLIAVKRAALGGGGSGGGFGLVSGRALAGAGAIASSAVLAVTPALLLYARWMYRSTRPPAPDEFLLPNYAVGSTSLSSFQHALKAPSQLIADLPAYLDLVKGEQDGVFFLGLAAVFGGCVAIARLHTWKRPPVMELACAATLASYFFLPEHWAGQAVIGSRQIGFGLWFAAAFFAPIPARVSILGRLFPIVAGIWLSVFHLVYWSKALAKFENDEVAGLAEVLDAAPSRKKMHYVNIQPDSRYFHLNSFWHIEKWYMLDKQGQCFENPAYGVMNSIHYRAGVEPHRVTHHEHDWPDVMEIWQNFDLVLVHRWSPNAHDTAMANLRGERIAKSGEWELWRSKLTTAGK